MYGECWVLRTPHFPVLIGLAQLESARCVAKVTRLRQQFRGVVIILEHDVLETVLWVSTDYELTRLMEQSELV